MHRLEKKGMEKSIIFGFISSLKSCLLDNPNMNHSQINIRLQFLGWDDFEMDYHTLQLAKACFEAESLKNMQTYSDLIVNHQKNKLF